MRGEQVSYNIVEHPKLKEKLKEVIEEVHGPILRELNDFLHKEGIPIPEIPPDKPVGDYRHIPEGAKLSDEEVASLLSFNLVLGINYACRGMVEAVRPDVATMFAQFQMKKLTFSIALKELLMKEGWLKIPPPYMSTASVK